MNTAIERFLSLRVKDVMNPNVVHLSADATMAEAARTLDDHEITGAPVVDREGRCVGVLSRSDFVPHEAVYCTVSPYAGSSFDEPRKSERTTPGRIAPNQEDPVSDHMSPLVRTISDEATIINAARVMCGEHMHRLVIVDEENHPTGIIGTLDLVAAIVAAIEQ